MRMTPKQGWVGLVITVVILLGVWAQASQPVAESSQAYPPLSTLLAAQAFPHISDNLEGQPVMIRFSSSWCHACQSLEPAWQAWLSQWEHPVIEVWLEPSPTQDTVVSLSYQHWRIYDPNFQMAMRLGVDVIPQTFYYQNDHYQSHRQGSELPVGPREASF